MFPNSINLNGSEDVRVAARQMHEAARQIERATTDFQRSVAAFVEVLSGFIQLQIKQDELLAQHDTNIAKQAEFLEGWMTRLERAVSLLSVTLSSQQRTH